MDAAWRLQRTTFLTKEVANAHVHDLSVKGMKLEIELEMGDFAHRPLGRLSGVSEAHRPIDELDSCLHVWHRADEAHRRAAEADEVGVEDFELEMKFGGGGGAGEPGSTWWKR